MLMATATTFVKSHENIIEQLLVCNSDNSNNNYKEIPQENCLVDWNNFLTNIFRKEYFVWKNDKKGTYVMNTMPAVTVTVGM